MNFLQLCQRACVECGVSSTLSTVVNQTGSLGRIVNWVGTAWQELQTKNDDWNFMRSSNILGDGASFATVAGQASYELGIGAGKVGIDPDTFGKWDRQTFRCYTTSVGVSDEMFLKEISFDEWRNSYMLGTMRSQQSRPIVAAIGPDERICVGPPSDGLYTFTADYFMAPTEMTADTDEPTGLPKEFHMAIIYDCMRMYAGYEAAPEVMERGNTGYARLITRLERNRAIQITTAGALA